MTIYDESKRKPAESIDPVKPGPSPIKLPVPGAGAATVVDAIPDGRARLEQYAERMRQRAKIVEDIFADDDYAPAKNKEYQKFLKDQAATSAMRYVVTGQVEPLDELFQEAVGAAVKNPDAKAEALRKQGFTVSGDAKVAASVKDGETGKDEEEPQVDPAVAAAAASDSAFLDTPAVRLAVAIGFNPDASDDE